MSPADLATADIVGNIVLWSAITYAVLDAILDLLHRLGFKFRWGW